jgi:hypothetical protein
MRPILIRALFVIALTGAIAGSLVLVRAGTNQTPKSPSTPKKPVLVELFTSEGCSSCPPADALLAKLGAQQSIAGAETIILEEHVNYWDDGGWRDPYASAALTKRQEEYANVLEGGVYTPEMIVDGRAAFVGSASGEARREIEAATGAAKAEVQLEWVKSESGANGGSPALHIRVGKLPSTADGTKPEVFLAVTENHLHSNVARGENSGRALDHDGVVRQFTRLGTADIRGDTAFGGQAIVKLTGDWKRENLHAVVFVQDPRTRRVFAVAAIPF